MLNVPIFNQDRITNCGPITNLTYGPGLYFEAELLLIKFENNKKI